MMRKTVRGESRTGEGKLIANAFIPEGSAGN